MLTEPVPFEPPVGLTASVTPAGRSLLASASDPGTNAAVAFSASRSSVIVMLPSRGKVKFWICSV